MFVGSIKGVAKDHALFRPKPLVSDAEVRAAKNKLDEMAALAGREQPVPDTLVRIILEEAAMVRVGMKPTPQQR